jgi:hypothetical protein
MVTMRFSISHRLNAVEDQTENDLLKLDVVAENRERISFGHANQ